MKRTFGLGFVMLTTSSFAAAVDRGPMERGSVASRGPRLRAEVERPAEAVETRAEVAWSAAARAADRRRLWSISRSGRRLGQRQHHDGYGGGPCERMRDANGASPRANLDIFIMQDRSLSMADRTASGDTKWKVITDAVVAFAKDAKSAGIGAGLGFFGTPAQGGGGRGGFLGSSCDAAVYANPAVPIASLNGNAGPIGTAIQGTGPATDTPTEPALHGAIDYARAWAGAHPTHKVIVVLSTDGLPRGCNSSVQGAVTIAENGVAGSPSIETYVIGVFGSKDCPSGLNQQCSVVDNTNAIAKGGGTGSAFIVDTGKDAEAQFVSAMNAIRTANQVACEYTVPAAPDGQSVDLSRASVRYTPSGGAAADIPWSTKPSACDASSGGWYYDDVQHPGKIIFARPPARRFRPIQRLASTFFWPVVHQDRVLGVRWRPRWRGRRGRLVWIVRRCG